MPSLVQLQYALAVQKERHFAKAAKSCHISQPTLSQQLQKLEDEIKLILFDRNKKPILVTPEGARFLDQAKRLLREHEKLLSIASESREGELTGEFRLGIIPTVASDLLPVFLKAFSQKFGKVKLFVEEMKTESILSALSEDQIDGGILATPIEGLEFKVHPLYYENFYVYLSANHALLKYKELTRDQLEDGQLWLLQDGHCFKDQVMSFCSVKKEMRGSIHLESGNLSTLLKLVKNDFGYTLIPALTVQEMDPKERERHVRPFIAPVPSREISMIYRRDHWKLQILQALEAMIDASLPPKIPRKPSKDMKVLAIS